MENTKPKGKRFAGLYRRGRIIYCDRRRNGERLRFSCETEDWEEAAAHVERWEKVSNLPLRERVPTFGALIEQTLEHMAKRNRSHTTLSIASYVMRGPLQKRFGKMRLDRITVDELRAWWIKDMQGTAPDTGRKYARLLFKVIDLAQDMGFLDYADSPKAEFEAWVKRWAEGLERMDSRNPIEDPDAMLDLLRGKLNAYEYTLILYLLDTGCRLGEARGVRWGDISDNVLNVFNNKPMGGPDKLPKNGKTRLVRVSRRLARQLAEHRLAQVDSGDGDYIFPNLNRDGLRTRFQKWTGHNIKDLRDTIASHLLTIGTPIIKVAALLGHSSTAITEASYAKYIPHGVDELGDLMAELPTRGKKAAPSI